MRQKLHGAGIKPGIPKTTAQSSELKRSAGGIERAAAGRPTIFNQ
jgi:hypothetical protein